MLHVWQSGVYCVNVQGQLRQSIELRPAVIFCNPPQSAWFRKNIADRKFEIGYSHGDLNIGTCIGPERV
jgi:hypothetical protein